MRILKETADKVLSEAAKRREQTNICKTRYLHGTLCPGSDRHKHESRANYPGRPTNLPRATGVV